MNDLELEVKFYICQLQAIEQNLLVLGAELVQPNVLETNLRFDTPTGEFTQMGRAIRLRQDTQARLTYKGPSALSGGARLRQEIEFVVEDFRAARNFLLALGYQVSLIYEKRRTTYDLGGAQVTLDQMPYGDFVEIEAPEAELIHQVAQRLHLNWEARIPDSYTVLFARLQNVRSLNFRDLTFDNFQAIQVTADDLGVRPADIEAPG